MYGTKHNFEFESIKKQCEEKKTEFFVSANQKVSELIEKGTIKKKADGTLDLGKGNDFIFYDYSFGLKFVGISTGKSMLQ